MLDYSFVVRRNALKNTNKIFRAARLAWRRDTLKGRRRLARQTISIIVTSSRTFCRYRPNGAYYARAMCFETKLFTTRPREMGIKSASHVALDSIVVFKENLALPRRKPIISYLVFIAQSRTRCRHGAHPHNRAASSRNRRTTCHSAHRIHARHAESVMIEGNYCNRDCVRVSRLIHPPVKLPSFARTSGQGHARDLLKRSARRLDVLRAKAQRRQ